MAIDKQETTCSYIKDDGTRCRRTIAPSHTTASSPQGYCFAHRINTAEHRIENARKAAQARWHGDTERDLEEVKKSLRAIAVKAKRQGKTSTAVQALNGILRAVEIEKRAREEDMEAYIEELEERLEARTNGRAWGLGTGSN